MIRALMRVTTGAVGRGGTCALHGFRAAFALLALLAACPAAPQELTLFGGASTARDLDESTYAWKIEYRQGLGEHFEVTYSWLNEGHVTGHHRDGHSLQLWARERLRGGRLSLAVGAGAMRYYDTVDSHPWRPYANEHGFAGLFSADAAYYFGNRWVVRAEAKVAWAPPSSTDTWNVLAGLGYQLAPPEAPGSRPWPARQDEPTTRNEVTMFVGQTVVNGFESAKALAWAVEFRKGFGRFFDASVAYVHEGDSRLVRRAGFGVQGWLGRAFLDRSLTISLGVGVYVATDEYKPLHAEGGSRTVAGLITPSLSYRFGSRALARFSWNRMASSYHRDTDVFLLGVGRRF